MNNILITINKELRSIFRDKKTLISILLFPFIIPFMIVLYGYILDTETESTARMLIDQELNDNIISIAKSINLELVYKTDLDNINYKEYDADGYIIYDTNTNTYNIYTDTSSINGLSAYTITNAFFKSLSEYMTKEYLVEKGIDIEEAYNNFNLNNIDLSTTNATLNIILSISFTYVIFAITLASSTGVVQATASEKENGTLETILTFPIKRSELIIGKYLSSVILSIVAALISFILLIITLIIAKNMFIVYQSFDLIINYKTIIGSLVIILSSSLFISGFSYFLSSRAKTFREAQSKLQSLNMISMIPLFVSMLDIEVNKYYYLIPICSYEQVLQDLFTSNINVTNISLCLISTIIYTIIVIFVVIKTYKQEHILFS